MDDTDSWCIDVSSAFSGEKMQFNQPLEEVAEKILMGADDLSGKYISTAQIGPISYIKDDSNEKISKLKMSKRTKKKKKAVKPPDNADESNTLRNAMLDVIKFGITSGGLKTGEKEDAEKHLALRLGAKAQKRKAVNYKEFKETRKAEKAAEREANLHGSRKVVMKKKDKRKTKRS